MREKLIHELEEERRLRLESEKQVREVTLESECSRVQMHALQEQFSRMEETVRNLLQNQGSLEQNAAETMNIMKVYQAKLSDDSGKHKEAMQDTNMAADEDCRSESSVEEEKEKTKLLLERLRALEAENSALAMENENQREQYERCLDEVANQVVQALLTQKDLREECLKLRTRVFDLEQQNRTLSVLFQQKVRPASDLLLQTKEISVKVAANETEHSSEVACQDHVLVSSCQMRTLDSGIGTFPLPDSTHRATGRHLPKPEHGLETQVFTSQEQELLPSGVLPKAKTLEREVPSATESCSPGEGIISYSVSDPAMVVKVPIPFQSRLPKPATSGK
uniref:NCK associated protein 5 n=1 Tax=Latimeria chalumnae TaxID=7897 RepID=M3XIA0_LATCH